jgi:hypothetical protein
VQAFRERLITLAEPDLVKLGELAVVPGHYCQVLYDIALLGHDLDIRQPLLAPQKHVHGSPTRRALSPPAAKPGEGS